MGVAGLLPTFTKPRRVDSESTGGLSHARSLENRSPFKFEPGVALFLRRLSETNRERVHPIGRHGLGRSATGYEDEALETDTPSFVESRDNPRNRHNTNTIEEEA